MEINWVFYGGGFKCFCDIPLSQRGLWFSFDAQWSLACVQTFPISGVCNHVPVSCCFSRIPESTLIDAEICSLQFVVHPTSQCIRKSCIGKLRKWGALHSNLKQVEEQLFNEYSSKALKAGYSVKKKAQGI